MTGHTLITGGAGFVGTNLADRIASDGGQVLVFDNLSRAGVEENLRWLTERHGAAVDVEIADLRDVPALRRAVRGAAQVFHLAGQVAVTTSLDEPMEDASVNLIGTLNLLEAVRERSAPPPVVFTSTNKVYGSLPDVELAELATRYEPRDTALLASGVGEDRPLSFCTPYGCSKGAADQYVVDWAPSYGVPTVVFRMSCIYGPHQFGTEDQGWVAHFLIRALEGEPITIYGDGKQVRDVLFVDDLVDALLRAARDAGRLAGAAFNIGGGVRNCVSLLELVEIIAELEGAAPDVRFDGWRPGDQRYYVSDTSAFRAATGWRPATAPRDGVARLHAWLDERRATAGARAAA
ncbi:MAG TPA: NAD-dependent epimerase/dehydratase family protein [Solirubrobacteraceae bacterium]|nr:NAD-dependent epimerase/dehydratase family protein [Solirubrobacteraceae bacterium]